MKDNVYYVYEWIRLDTNEPFYIGKGKGKRAYTMYHERNKYFKNIVRKVPCAVIILHDNLTEEEANQIECWYIWQLRDIQGYWLVNLSDGGEGNTCKRTDEQKKKQSKAMKEKFKNNPELRKKVARPGKLNGMYGKGSKLEGSKNGRAKPILVYKNGEFYGEYPTLFEFAKEKGSKVASDPICAGVRRLARGWVPQVGKWKGWSVKYKDLEDRAI